jgi:hypothetical protein
MSPYFIGAFVIPLLALTLAAVFELGIPQLRESLPAALVRVGWDGAVTALGLCGAIGSEFVGLTRNTQNVVVAQIDANIALVEILVIFWVVIWLGVLVGIRAAKRPPGFVKAIVAIIVGGLALGVPGVQAYLIAISLRGIK